QEFQILGPFDNEGRRGHAAVYKPEQELSVAAADAVYEGKSRALPPRWRKVPAAAMARDGSLPLDSFLRPNGAATAYAACYVRNPHSAAVPIAVRAGSTGAIKVWVN